MSDDREELGRIARSLRRYVQREDARGLGDTLAGSVRAAAQRTVLRAATAVGSAAEGVSTPPVRTPAPVTPAAHERATLAPAPRATATPTERPVAPTVADVDLFGKPVERGVLLEEAEVDDAPPIPLPRFGAELQPVGAEARAAIAERSLPILTEVAAEVAECRKCGLCETRANTVPGVGSAESGIVFVGEAPGADEDRRGEPFVGRAGELLTKIIKAMDDAKLIPGVPLSRDTVYICNVLKCRPPENRNPLPHEIEACSPYLRRQLDALKPRIICCLGKFAAELLVGVKGTIGGLRGKVYRYHGAKLIVTYHPAACLRNPGYKRPVWDDMQLLAREYASN